ncbi:hypothetical protein Poly59_22220 [Rubripirellula reticaptiva]|uniref:Uncharacterized protein n=1 Tax=Rubripirellula reticaptiva TaxID=2528013 RepID=A0A5C6F815_9BACT|nr:hypothetical protein Poly59_22220 [Rubripirellula reticaptiva]
MDDPETRASYLAKTPQPNCRITTTSGISVLGSGTLTALKA